jgi:Flp pilus assembly protein CpaB
MAMENIMSSKLFTTRQGTVLLGVIAAVIAAIALVVYLNHYRSSGTTTISVLVANSLIQKGTSGDVAARSGLYSSASIPKSQVEKGAITNPAALTGTVALADINPRQQLTAADFGPATGLPYVLKPNERAVVVALGSPQAVGGQIGAGSHVDVWVTTSGQSAGGVNRPIARLLFQDVYVLGLSGDNVTLRAETPAQAGTLIYAAQNATIWLVLRPTIGTKTKSPVIGSGNLGG